MWVFKCQGSSPRVQVKWRNWALQLGEMLNTKLRNVRFVLYNLQKSNDYSRSFCDEMLALFFGICKVLFETMYFKRDVHHLWWWELSKCPATSCYKSCRDQNPNQSLHCKHATCFFSWRWDGWLIGLSKVVREKNLLYCKYVARSWKRKKKRKRLGWRIEFPGSNWEVPGGDYRSPWDYTDSCLVMMYNHYSLMSLVYGFFEMFWDLPEMAGDFWGMFPWSQEDGQVQAEIKALNGSLVLKVGIMSGIWKTWSHPGSSGIRQRWPFHWHFRLVRHEIHGDLGWFQVS